MDRELSKGEQVGGYRVVSVLGRGGMARVYRALGPDDREVALKLILTDLASDDSYRRRFELEASIAQRVSHPNVVAVLDSGEHEGVMWLTQTLVHGGSLTERLLREGTLGVDAALRLADEVGGGLDAVHASGLVHRDVKPANILIDEDGSARITDFGLVRDTDSASRLTRPGQTLGSMNYMAPEQVRGDDVGPFTDIYALGCVVFECLTGAPPFADRQGMRVLLAQIEAEPPHPSDRLDGLPRDVGTAALLALAKDPQDRPATASAYAERLRAACA